MRPLEKLRRSLDMIRGKRNQRRNPYQPDNLSEDAKRRLAEHGTTIGDLFARRVRPTHDITIRPTFAFGAFQSYIVTVRGPAAKRLAGMQLKDDGSGWLGCLAFSDYVGEVTLKAVPDHRRPAPTRPPTVVEVDVAELREAVEKRIADAIQIQNEEQRAIAAARKITERYSGAIE